MKDIDIRVRIMVLILVSIGILFFKTESAVYAALVFAIIWAGSILGIKKILPQILLFVGLEIILVLIKDIRYIGNLPLLIIYLRRLVIAVVTAYPVSKAPTGKLIASLDKLKVPRTATISLAVLFRFMPTVLVEYSAIRKAQRYRNIGNTLREYITCIPQLFE
nr:energy-coupling factor transporter transmembrane protein EcfT [Eubacterium sp.]